MCRLRYWRLCSQLARQERLEELEAASMAAEVRPRPSKDAPDMETLRQDVQKLALKVTPMHLLGLSYKYSPTWFVTLYTVFALLIISADT